MEGLSKLEVSSVVRSMAYKSLSSTVLVETASQIKVMTLYLEVDIEFLIDLNRVPFFIDGVYRAAIKCTPILEQIYYHQRVSP